MEERRHHGSVVLKDFTELHKLIDLNFSIVVAIELKADFSNIVNIAYFFLVHVQKKVDDFFLRDVEVFLPQRNEAHDQ